jgi:hypothetical protein
MGGTQPLRLLHSQKYEGYQVACPVTWAQWPRVLRTSPGATALSSREKQLIDLERGYPGVWEHADENKLGTLYRAKIKFDRAIWWDGKEKTAKAIMQMGGGDPNLRFEDLTLFYRDWKYPVGCYVCVNLLGSVDIWDKRAFEAWYEPWPENASRSSSRFEDHHGEEE